MAGKSSEATIVVEALRVRVGALENERAVLALRARNLDVELEATRSSAQRLAEEAIQLKTLIAFYENGTERSAVKATAPAQDRFDASPKDAAEVSNDVDAASVALPARRPTTQWTQAWREQSLAVLREAAGPMHYRELYRAIAAHGFTFGGKSPEATFLASLNRDQESFTGVGRGCYWIAGEAVPSDKLVPGPKRRARRPRPIGRATANR